MPPDRTVTVEGWLVRASLTAFRLVVLAVALVVGMANQAGSQPQAGGGRRVALVIGNGHYSSVDRLANPANDARLMALTLREAGFVLVGGGPQLDLDKTHFDRAVQAFGREIQGADVALFYYSGHGMQVQGTNWLVPVDASPTGARELDFQAIDAALVLRQMEGAGTRLNLVILDACRNNPFASRGLRATAGGLAEMRAPEGTLISYATQPGNVAADGGDGNSPYTAALATEMRRPGQGVFQVFNQVGLSVKAATGGQQQPWLATSPITGDFYFFNGPVTVTPQGPASEEAVFWQSVAQSSRPADLQAYLRRYPQGTFADLARLRLEALAAAPPPADRPARNRFDGAWVMTVGCERSADGADGFTRRFPTAVRASVLRGEAGTDGRPGWMLVEGTIEADGSAVLSVHGLTGNRNDSIGRRSPGSPYAYLVQARFEARRGTGARIGARACSFNFAKP